MIKKTITTLLMFVFVFTFSNVTNAQESEDYAMWELLMLTPDYENLKTLQENMRKHNEKYHSEGPYNATVYNIVSGPNAGKMIWQMGPMMLKHNDTRPSDDGHDESWRDTVMPYVKEFSTIEYWRQDNEKSNTGMLAGPEFTHPLLFIRYFEINDDHDYLMDTHFKEVSETVKSMEGEHPWGLYYNMFLQGDLGRHVATVRFYKNWTEMDEGVNFKKAYEALYGENSWDGFLERIDDIFTNQWDEIWAYNKALSGD